MSQLLESLEFSDRIRFLPWIGSEYESHPGWPGRVLLMGESHYADDRDNRELTREVIERQWNGESYSYFTKLAQAMLGKPLGEIDKRQFWASVAFYNFVQDIVADVARVPPSAKQWEQACDSLPEVVDKLSPRYVVATGKRLWCHLPDWPQTTPLPFNATAWEVCAGTTLRRHKFKATYIHHPSSSAFGSSLRWYPLLTEFMR
jgi:hypothetical protein